MDPITREVLSLSRGSDHPVSGDVLAKAKAYDEWEAKRQLEALGAFKPTDMVRIKARSKVWANDGLKFFPKEVFETPYPDARRFVEGRHADVTTEPLSQSAIERHEVELGQRAYREEQLAIHQRRMAAVNAAMRGDI